MPATYELDLREPCVMKVRSADKSREVLIDVFEAWRFLIEAQKEVSEAGQWGKVRDFLCSRLQVPPEEVSENVCWQFHETVVAIANAECDTLKKTAKQTASSLPPTPVSQVTSDSGIPR